MDADLIRAIQIIAIDSVENQTYESFYREVARWYSKTFATPLHTVLNDLTDLEVLQTYYEEVFTNHYREAADNKALKEQWEQMKTRVITPPAELEKQEKKIEEEEEIWANQLREEMAKGIAAVTKKTVQKAAKAAAEEIVKKVQEKPNIPINTSLPDTLEVKGEDEVSPNFEE